MKTRIFQQFPRASIAAALNILLALIILNNAVLVQGQDTIRDQENDYATMNGQCSLVDAVHGVCSNDALSKYLTDDSEMEAVSSSDGDNKDEEPMLAKMPGLDFKAYRRADISSFYREPPGSRTERINSATSMAGKFINMSPERLDLNWDDGNGPPGYFMAHAGPFQATGTSPHVGHVFHLVRPQTDEVVCSFTMTIGTSVYYCNPYEDNNPNDPSVGYHAEETRPLDALSDAERQLYDHLLFDRAFAGYYKNFTGGSEWLGLYPTEPPRHWMWRADYFGQVHTIVTTETQFIQLPPEDDLTALSLQEMKAHVSSDARFQPYRQPGNMTITIKAISCAPRIFEIENFLSDVEVDQ